MVRGRTWGRKPRASWCVLSRDPSLAPDLGRDENQQTRAPPRGRRAGRGVGWVPWFMSSGQSPHCFEAPALGCSSGSENTGHVSLF